MDAILNLPSSTTFGSIAAILLCLLYLGVFALVIYRFWEQLVPLKRAHWISMAVFAAWAIILNIGPVSLNTADFVDIGILRNARVFEENNQLIYPLGLLPIVLAAGYLGLIPALMIGLISGATRFGMGHSLFAPFELATLGLIYALHMKQAYKGRTPNLARNPVVAVFTSLLLLSVVMYANRITWFPRPLPVMIDSAFRTTQASIVLLGVELLIAALVVLMVRFFVPVVWGVARPTRIPPYETSIRNRVLWRVVPLLIGGVYLFSLFIYYRAQNTATDLILRQVHTSAVVASEQTEAIILLARDQLEVLTGKLPTEGTDAEIQTFLDNSVGDVATIFSDLIYVESGLETVITTDGVADTSILSADELVAVEDAFERFDDLLFPDASDEVSIVYYSRNDEQVVNSVVVGRFALGGVNLSLPINQALRNPTAGDETQGFLVDSDNQIVFHIDAERIGTQMAESRELFMLDAPIDLRLMDGSKDLQTTISRHIEVGTGQQLIVLTRDVDQDNLRYKFVVPYSVVQSEVTSIWLPSMVSALLMLAFVAGVIGVDARRWLRQATRLATEAKRIGQGDLSNRIPADESLHELGQLQNTIEGMRNRLQRRVNQLNQLLSVTSTIASSFDKDLALDAIMDAALAEGEAQGVRIVLPTEDAKRHEKHGFGSLSDLMEPLDEVLFNHIQARNELMLPTLHRYRGFLKGVEHSNYVKSLVAVPIVTAEGDTKGLLWIGRESQELPAESVKEFLQILAGQVAVALSNAHLFKSSEDRGERLASILTSIQDAVVVTDNDGRLEMANETAHDLLRFGPFNPQGQPIDRLVDDIELQAMFRSWSPTGDKPIEVEIQGSNYAVTHNWLGAEKRVGRVTRFSDITHFKTVDKIKSDLINMVSNDLRKPLHSINSFVELLRTSWKLDESELRFLRGITDNTQRMMSIVEQLLNLERIEDDRPLSLEEFDVVKLAQGLVAEQHAEIDQRELKVKFRNMHVPKLFADRTMIELALRNLLENAVRYNKQGGKIDLSIEHVGPDVLVIVSDTGSGIAPQDQDKIFEKFWRVPRRGDTDENTSAGLGLSIVKTVAQQHRGDVTLESKLGIGSTFYFKIPVRQPQPSKPDKKFVRRRLG